MRIEDYLDKHKIVKIGNTIGGYICCEMIVDNPMELIPIVRENDCYISEIRWWDLVEIASGSSIGYGGPRDPRNADSHFFSETDICKIFNHSARDEDYCGYLTEVKRRYCNLNLFPAFDIKRRGKGNGLRKPRGRRDGSVVP